MLIGPLSYSSLVGGVSASVAALVLIIIGLVLCVCGGKSNTDSQDVEDNKKDKRKSKSSTTSEEALLQTASVEKESTKKNGIISGDNRESKKDRALPAIPPTNTSLNSNLPNIPYADAEDENYDLPGKDSKRKSTQEDTRPDRYDPYASVEGSGDGMYSAVKDLKVKSKESPYSHVKEPRENVYAKVDGETSAQSSASATVTRLITPDNDSTTYASVAPPIPEKHFDEESSSPHNNTRDSSHSNTRDSHHSNTADDELGAVGGDPISSPAADAVPGKEPSYSQVTARESLKNMRERESHEPDDFYETVKEEDETETVQTGQSEILNLHSDSTDGSSVPRQETMNINMSGDLYAEIQGESGGSMYATVVDRDNDHAPTPPPVGILKNLRNSQHNDNEDIDPGYTSVESQRRPKSANVTDHSTKVPANTSSEAISQMYASVNKPPTRSKTVHSTRDFESATATTSATSTDTTAAAVTNLSHLYAQVNKQKPNQNNDQNKSESVSTLPSQVEGQKAVNSKTLNVGSRDESEPGYDTVKDVTHGDPDYSRIRENTPIDEERYATVEETMGIGELGTMSDGRDNESQHESVGVGVSVSVSHVTMVHVSNVPPSQADISYKKKEHLYQEIDETKLNGTDHETKLNEIDPDLLSKVPVTHL